MFPISDHPPAFSPALSCLTSRTLNLDRYYLFWYWGYILLSQFLIWCPTSLNSVIHPSINRLTGLCLALLSTYGLFIWYDRRFKPLNVQLHVSPCEFSVFLLINFGMLTIVGSCFSNITHRQFFRVKAACVIYSFKFISLLYAISGGPRGMPIYLFSLF